MNTRSSGGDERVLVVGATGHLGGKIARRALARGHRVRALVRPKSDPTQLEAEGIEVVRGDLLDPASLNVALQGCTAVIASAIGYANRRRGDIQSAADTLGNRHLVDAALASGVRRFVFCSVLTCDRAQDVPHFWNKKLVEDYLVERQVPFVSLRPGAFLDQGPNDFWVAGIRTGHLPFLANPSVPITFVHTDDVAEYLVAAMNPAIPSGSRIDIGCDRAVAISELASIMAALLHRPIKPQVPPWPLVSLLLGVGGLFDPWKRDLRAMMSYFRRGGYVADTAQQREHFGPPPRIEDAIARYLAGVGLLSATSTAAGLNGRQRGVNRSQTRGVHQSSLARRRLGSGREREGSRS
jgi:uncharacterized protein YbjT (DUF2867 family)